ncbi:MAG: hypothetical protein ABS42_00350 [Bdellovibrio sp. SCN 50-8]|nr:MAG: hypothetical protein ABS42_00350 [Bdellovibrio sp. SCN 50-8]
MKRAVLLSLFSFTGFLHHSKAALPAIDIRPEIKVDVREVLSLPPENRLLVAASRSSELKQPLEKFAFNKEHDYNDRWKAVVLYAQISGQASHPFLSKAVKSSEWFMRNAALMAYQEVLPGRATDIAKHLLSDEALVVRSAAIAVLEKHLDSEIREILWSELEQPRNFRKKQSLWTRPQILEILAKSPMEHETPLFVVALREKETRINVPAIQGLERLTRQQPAKGITDIAAKKDLWLKWVKSNPSTKNL